MTDLKDIILISLQDGYYNVSFYLPKQNVNSTTRIKIGESFTYEYNGIIFNLFKKYSNGIYSITDINAFENHMNNLPNYVYKFDYEELVYLTIKKLFDSSLEIYKTYNPKHSELPLFKIVFSDCYKTIQHKNKSLYHYFYVAIAQNMKYFNIEQNNLTLDFASNIYPYYLYGETIYGATGAPTKLNPEFEHCIFDIGYSTITCYIYKFKTQIIKENLTNLIISEERTIVTSHELKSIFVLQFGIFNFISGIYSEIIDNSFEIKNPNSSYEYATYIQNSIPENIKTLSFYNQTIGAYFKDSNEEFNKIYKDEIYKLKYVNFVIETLSKNIEQFNVISYHINSIINFEWYFHEFLNLKFYDINGINSLLIDSLFYKYGTINNLIYRNIVLTRYPIGLKEILNETDEYNDKNKLLSRKRTSTMPELKIDMNFSEINPIPISNIDNYLQLFNYIKELNSKYSQMLSIKANFQKNKTKLIKIYGSDVVNGVYNKLLFLSLNDPSKLQLYLNDFNENPESYL